MHQALIHLVRFCNATAILYSSHRTFFSGSFFIIFSTSIFNLYFQHKFLVSEQTMSQMMLSSVLIEPSPPNHVNFGVPMQMSSELITYVGKTFWKSKVKIVWVVGFSNSLNQTTITLTDSLISGKKLIVENDKIILEISNHFPIFTHKWYSTEYGCEFSITISLPSRNTYSLCVNEIKFEDLMSKKPNSHENREKLHKILTSNSLIQYTNTITSHNIPHSTTHNTTLSHCTTVNNYTQEQHQTSEINENKKSLTDTSTSFLHEISTSTSTLHNNNLLP